MIANIIADVFMRIGQTWRIGGMNLQPQEDEVEIILDEAAKKLYNEDLGARFEMGGLIVEKREGGHDVYCYVGSYE